MWDMLGERPSKGKVWWQKRHFSVRRVQDLKRRESGIWDSKGVRSAAWPPKAEEEVVLAMEYFFVSRPRHSARRTAEVPGMGAQRRSMGGKICFRRYHSMSGLRVEEGEVTSAGAKARLAVDSRGSKGLVSVEMGVVMM